MEPQIAVSAVRGTVAASPKLHWLRVVRPLEHDAAPLLITQQALACLRETTEEVELPVLWSSLRSGRLHISKLISVEDETIAVVEERSVVSEGHRVQGRRLEVLERVLSGRSLNCIAIELGLSNSTISSEFKQAARQLGFGDRLSDLPVLIAQLWLSVTAPTRLKARVGRLELAGLPRLVVAVPGVDFHALQRLSTGEADVCKLLLRGQTHAQIALTRGTARRTTANQIAAIFRKLGVSGRLELVTTIVREALLVDEPAPQRGSLVGG